MNYYNKIYGAEGALLVVNDSGTYRGWNPTDESAAKEALTIVDGTKFESNDEVQKVISQNELPPTVDKDTVKNVKEEYKLLTP